MPESGSAAGFFFIRHGETLFNRGRIRSGGECDPPMTALGVQQSRQAETVLAALDRSPGLILTSPHRRTYDTAHIVNESLNVEILVDDGLQERRLGLWNELPYDATGELLASGKTPPGGEPNDQFRERVLGAFRKRADIYSRWPAVISSSGVARVILQQGGKTRQYASRLSNGSILAVTLENPIRFHISRIEMIHNAAVAAQVKHEPGEQPDQGLDTLSA